VEDWVRELAGYLALLIETTAILIVAIGSIEALTRLIPIVFRPRATHGERKAVWRRFGVWLLLALEFELAADIVRSVISPTWQDIGTLAAIAIIRTFLNYFLEKDLESTEEATDVPGERQMRLPSIASA
jgi:uncharacterized membrane protein